MVKAVECMHILTFQFIALSIALYMQHVGMHILAIAFTAVCKP